MSKEGLSGANKQEYRNERTQLLDVIVHRELEEKRRNFVAPQSSLTTRYRPFRQQD